MILSSGRLNGAYASTGDMLGDLVDVPDTLRSPHMAPPIRETLHFDANNPTTQEHLKKAYGTSDASLALQEGSVPLTASRKHLETQRRDMRHASQNLNILPMGVNTNAYPVTDQFYGDLGVEDRVKSGKTFTDRLGNTFDIYESVMPPKEKDYRPLDSSSAQRQLERCMGGSDAVHRAPKREVIHETNPAEEEVDVGQERSCVMQVHGRQTFFNQAGMQHPSEFDTTRNQYDGYNVKTPYNQLVKHVDPTWRATQMKAVSTASEPVIPGKRVDASPYVKRTELSSTFARTPQKMATVVSAKATSLPFVPAATVRASNLPDGARTRSKHAVNVEAAPAKSHVSTNYACSGTKTTDGGTRGRYAIASATTHPADHEPRSVHREYDPPVDFAPHVPVATVVNQETDQLHDDDQEVPDINSGKMIDAATREREETDQLHDDDQEVADINSGKMIDAATRERENVHVTRKDVTESEQTGPTQVIDAKVIHGQATANGLDAMPHDDYRLDTSVRCAPARSNITLYKGDVKKNVSDPRESALVEARGLGGHSVYYGHDEVSYKVADNGELTGSMGAIVVSHATVHGTDAILNLQKSTNDATSMGLRAKPEVTVSTERKHTHRATEDTSHMPGQSIHAKPTFYHRERAYVNVPTSKDASTTATKLHSHVQLPFVERAGISIRKNAADVTVQGRVEHASEYDGPVPQRTTVFSEAVPAPHLTHGKYVNPSITMPKRTDENNLYARTQAGTLVHAQASEPIAHDIIESNRATMGAHMEAKNTGTDSYASNGPVRVLPTTSDKMSGIRRVDRLGGRANQRGASGMHSGDTKLARDRSTPTRSITPSVASDARWTPSIQVESLRT